MLLAAAHEAARRERLQALQRVIELQQRHAAIMADLDLPPDAQRASTPNCASGGGVGELHP